MSNNPIVRYSDAELAEFKQLIVDKLEKANKELEFMREQIMEMNENRNNQQSGNWFDDSSLHLELEMLNNMVSRQHQFIRNLENALIRIENKTYGICTITGELIDKKRLMLVPHATKNVAAKEMENSQKKHEPSFTSYSALDELRAEREERDKAREAAAGAKEEPKKKIISKVIKKSGGLPKKNAPPVTDDPEDWEMDLDYDDDDAEESSYKDTMMNIDDISDMADDEQYSE